MAKGTGLRKNKEQLLQNSFKTIGNVYSKGLYGFIEEKPAYYDELVKLEERIHHLVISDYKSAAELKRELSKYCSLHERASKAYGLTK